MTQAPIEASKAAIIVVKDTENHDENSRKAQPTSRMSEPVIKHPTFDLTVPGKYHELNNFKLKSETYL